MFGYEYHIYGNSKWKVSNSLKTIPKDNNIKQNMKWALQYNAMNGIKWIVMLIKILKLTHKTQNVQTNNTQIGE